MLMHHKNETATDTYRHSMPQERIAEEWKPVHLNTSFMEVENDIHPEARSRSNSKTDINNLDLFKFKNYEGNDLQKLMEDLKVLQKMSSPLKSESLSQVSTSSHVSVITSSKTSPLAHVSEHDAGNIPHRDNIVNFQEEFQRQLLESLGHESKSKSFYNGNQ